MEAKREQRAELEDSEVRECLERDSKWRILGIGFAAAAVSNLASGVKIRSPGQRPGRSWYRREPGEAKGSVERSERAIVKYLTQCGARGEGPSRGLGGGG